MVEVIVALMLLGIGVSGTMASITAAARLRDAARAREAMSAAAADRLDWFRAYACAALDTVSADTAARVISAWSVTDSATIRQLRIDVRDARQRVPDFRVEARFPCA